MSFFPSLLSRDAIIISKVELEENVEEIKRRRKYTQLRSILHPFVTIRSNRWTLRNRHTESISLNTGNKSLRISVGYHTKSQHSYREIEQNTRTVTGDTVNGIRPENGATAT